MSSGVFVLIVVVYLVWYFGTDAGKAKQQRETAKRDAKRQSRMVAKANCPTCRSSSVERVTIGTRAASGVMGGLIFSKKARAQFHCRSCNYYW